MLRRLTILTLTVGLTVGCPDDDEATNGAGDVTSTDATDGTDETDGTDGTDETDGTDGTDETDGTDGTDETDGTDGTDETDGTDGTDETDGTDGTDETDGTDGTDVTDGTDGTDVTDGTDGTDSTDGEPMGEDNPPTPGAQIDRIGRPTISTALIGTFTEEPAKGELKDDYNEASDPANWSQFEDEIESNLALYDALDATCGNQLLADGPEGTTEDRYSFLATVLADDRLYVNSDSDDCTTYLGVEAQVVGAVTDGGCGGRTLTYDVIDMSYTVLATGALDMSVGDGVDMDAAAPLTEFPYLPAPITE